MTVPHAPKRLAELPPSAMLVYKTLYHEGCMTRMELRGATHLSEKSVRRALDTLTEHGLAEGRPDPDNPRRRIYDVTWSN